MADELSEIKSQSHVGAFAIDSLSQGILLRKSFEYRTSGLDSDLVLKQERLLWPSFSSRANHKRGTSLDAFWVRELAIVQLVREVHGLPYAYYLPGRVYSYRMMIAKAISLTGARSLIDVGCGSGMALHEAARLGVAASGIDVSWGALTFAWYLAKEFNSPNLSLAQSDALLSIRPPLASADLVLNLGSLEHLSFEQQIRFAKYMGDLSNKHVLIAIPNTVSPIFQVMEKTELSIAGMSVADEEWTYPEEPDQNNVDFNALASELDWKIEAEGNFHVASTSFTANIPEVEEMRSTVRKSVIQTSMNFENVLKAWEDAETRCSDDTMKKLGWFRFVLFKVRKT